MLLVSTLTLSLQIVQCVTKAEKSIHLHVRNKLAYIMTAIRITWKSYCSVPFWLPHTNAQPLHPTELVWRTRCSCTKVYTTIRTAEYRWKWSQNRSCSHFKPCYASCIDVWQRYQKVSGYHGNGAFMNLKMFYNLYTARTKHVAHTERARARAREREKWEWTCVFIMLDG